MQLLRGATHDIFFTLGYPMNYKEVFAAGQRGHVSEMLLEPWPTMLPMAAWERSNTLAREKTMGEEKENNPGHRGQLLPDTFPKPECYHAQLKQISAGKSTLSLHVSQGSDQPAGPGLQASSCATRTKGGLAQPAFPSFLHYQTYITAFSPATSRRAHGLLVLRVCLG